MLELARQRLGEDAVLHQAGLGGAPLPFPDGAFDDAIACLVLHYLDDWSMNSARSTAFSGSGAPTPNDPATELPLPHRPPSAMTGVYGEYMSVRDA